MPENWKGWGNMKGKGAGAIFSRKCPSLFRQPPQRKTRDAGFYFGHGPVLADLTTRVKIHWGFEKPGPAYPIIFGMSPYSLREFPPSLSSAS